MTRRRRRREGQVELAPTLRNCTYHNILIVRDISPESIEAAYRLTRAYRLITYDTGSRWHPQLVDDREGQFEEEEEQLLVRICTHRLIRHLNTRNPL